MDDADEVGLGHRIQRLNCVVGGHRHRQGAITLEEHGQVRAVQVLHHDVRQSVVERADIEDPGDVLAREPNRGLRLAGEAPDVLRLGRALGQHELERHPLLELEMGRSHHDAHAPAPEQLFDAVLAGEYLARPHWRGSPHGRLHPMTLARMEARCYGRVWRRPTISSLRMGRRSSWSMRLIGTRLMIRRARPIPRVASASHPRARSSRRGAARPRSVVRRGGASTRWITSSSAATTTAAERRPAIGIDPAFRSGGDRPFV